MARSGLDLREDVGPQGAKLQEVERTPAGDPLLTVEPASAIPRHEQHVEGHDDREHEQHGDGKEQQDEGDDPVQQPLGERVGNRIHVRDGLTLCGSIRRWSYLDDAVLIGATLLLLALILALAATARVFGPVAVVLTVCISFLAVLAETGDRAAALLVAGLAIVALLLLRSAAETAHGVSVARRDKERRRRHRSRRQAWESLATLEDLEQGEQARRAA
jgi:membrane protein implicated in regulation of membrane protease activity